MKLSKNDGGVYVASFKTATGKTKTITTKCTSLDEAKAVVKESGLANLEQAAKAGRLTREAIGHITTGKRLTMSKAMAAWADWMKSVGKAPKTIANSTVVVSEWVALQELESSPPSSVDEKSISAFINEESDAKAGTRVVKLSSIRSFFDYCAAKGWCMGNPAKLVRVNMGLLSHDQKEPRHVEPFEPNEVRKLLRALEERGETFWRFAVLISNEIGLRLGDIAQLQWKCFEEPGRVVVWTDKRDRRISVPISSDISEILSEVSVTSAVYLFPDQRDIAKDIKRRALLSVTFKRICTSLDIYRKSFHALRHSCISRWAKEGKSLESIGRDVGHTNTETTRTYIHK